ncbi:hypothetical protein [Halorubrum lipolyticum]|uniref:Uncharacterized protein n=1 Tax=Halorubrum lipolyticum DSM 21995 TaxID=1227482 RepID=M0NJC8_9EURY|nr:hypothetical protein [Halorubrum lipolyticum]EMA57214.1 hypothetical protein C469_15818 [Halorubrum lipolyticum DSM 21995]
MADTKSGRDKQARDEERRRIQRDISEARERGDELEPTADPPTECHRRGCSEPVAFSVTERYQEETGAGAVEATAFLCADHTAAESPVNLEDAYEGYVFHVEPVAADADD